MNKRGPERGGHGPRISQARWPASGAQREWLVFCDQIHQKNGQPSLRAMQGAAYLSATQIGKLLRGENLPTDTEQCENLLTALGAKGRPAIKEGLRLYAAALAERDRAAQAAGEPCWWPRSNYVDLVRQWVPRQLLDRKSELAELAAWCADADEPFVWWQAAPWAGKTALMSWLVLNPPPRTWVISFFVTGRLPSQSDSTAFTDALLDQLAAITGDKTDPGPSAPAPGRLRVRSCYGKAAAQAAGGRPTAGAGRRRPGRGPRFPARLRAFQHRRPACQRPPDGLLVIVAGRPDPPLPGDVMKESDHPLRHCRIRPLAASPHAIEIREKAREELNRVLGTDRDRHDSLGREVLGLVTASGGGLSHRDLLELTGRAVFEIDRLLDGEFGRIIACRAGPHTDQQSVPVHPCDPARAGRRLSRAGRASPVSPQSCMPGPTGTGIAAGPRAPRRTYCAVTLACSRRR